MTVDHPAYRVAAALGHRQRDILRLVADHPGAHNRNTARHAIGMDTQRVGYGYAPSDRLIERGLVELDDAGRMRLTAAGRVTVTALDELERL